MRRTGFLLKRRRHGLRLVGTCTLRDTDVGLWDSPTDVGVGHRSLPQIIGATSAEKNGSKAELNDLEIPSAALVRRPFRRLRL